MEASLVDHKLAGSTAQPLHLHRAHLIGIAGSGMRALADVLTGWGWEISGSDSNLDDISKRANRPKIFAGHDAEQISQDADIVVYSDAVPKDNPERRRAAELGIPTLSYFDMLGRLSAERHTVAVAGTHGKSTTTAMLAHILTEAGCDPTVFCGATPLGKHSGGRSGHNDLMLVEACEFRSNFLKLRPHDAAILNIEPDHFDCFDSLEKLEDAFRQFANLLPSDGWLLIKHPCDSARRATANAVCRLESFGWSAHADWSAKNVAVSEGRYRFALCHRNQQLCDMQLNIPGRHNVLNAVAASALAFQKGATPEQVEHGMQTFAGLHRRLEQLRPWRGVARVDDYAHHPTEVSAALGAVREIFPRRRVWCVFQPHQASRTARLMNELAASLQNADKVVVAEIFRAREGEFRPGEVTAAQ
jgi:UDP-N-acetylmuramate--alanine ligase